MPAAQARVAARVRRSSAFSPAGRRSAWPPRCCTPIRVFRLALERTRTRLCLAGCPVFAARVLPRCSECAARLRSSSPTLVRTHDAGYLPRSPHSSPDLPRSPHSSPDLPRSPHSSPDLPRSPQASPYHDAGFASFDEAQDADATGIASIAFGYRTSDTAYNWPAWATLAAALALALVAERAALLGYRRRVSLPTAAAWAAAWLGFALAVGGVLWRARSWRPALLYSVCASLNVLLSGVSSLVLGSSPAPPPAPLPEPRPQATTCSSSCCSFGSSACTRTGT